MSDLELIVQAVDYPSVDPEVAYAKLRSFTPGRPSFLWRCHDPSKGRYSIVGYRVRQGDISPPGIDAIQAQFDAWEGQPDAESFALGAASVAMGYYSGGNALTKSGAGISAEEGLAGQLNIGATVLVYDHQEQTAAVAGPSRGQAPVKRLIWELDNGPDIADLGEIDATARPAFKPTHEDAKLVAKLERARAFMEDELEELVVARTLAVGCGHSDPYDAYRALVRLAPAAFSYYFDFGDNPMAADAQLFGVADDLIFHNRRDAEARPELLALHDVLRVPKMVGKPDALREAGRLLQRIGEPARNFWGGAAGWIVPGGEANYVLVDQAVWVMARTYYLTQPARITEDIDGKQAIATADAGTDVGLAAIAYAIEHAPEPSEEEPSEEEEAPPEGAS